MKDMEKDELEKLGSQLAEYLKNNRHPHTAIVITSERIVVVEGVHSIPVP